MSMFDDIKEKVDSLPLFECITLLKRILGCEGAELNSILESHDDKRIRELLSDSVFVAVFESMRDYYRETYLRVYPGSAVKDIDAAFARSIHDLWSRNKEKALNTSCW